MDTGEQRNDPSHTWGTGGKARRNDFCALPLTREEHRELHDIGEKEFESHYNIDFKDEIIKHLSRFIQEEM